MILVLLLMVGIVAGVWVERTGKRQTLQDTLVYGAIFLAGMLIEGAATGAILETVMDQSLTRMISLPVSFVLSVYLAILIGVLIGMGGWHVYRRSRASRPA